MKANENSSLLVCIQARMGSKRLPGKSLAKLGGKTSLEHLIDSLLCSVNRTQVVILTSSQPENQVIQKLCEKRSINFFAGDEENVASRFLEVIKEKESKLIARLNGDSPLWDHRTLEAMLSLAKEKSADLYTSVGPKPFPSGSHVELFSAATFKSAYSSFKTQEDFEHVTHYFYQHPRDFLIERLSCPFAFDPKIKLSLDTEADYELLKKFFAELEKSGKILPEVNLKERVRIFKELSLKPGV